MKTNRPSFNLATNNQGFSIVEVMVAAGIMGSLAYFGITSTFDVVTNMKGQTAKAQIASEMRMKVGKALKDPAFFEAQTSIQDCMNTAGGKAVRNTCYNNETALFSPGQDKPLAIAPNLKDQKLKEASATRVEGGNSVKGTLFLKEYCDWNGTNNDCGNARADYVEAQIQYNAFNKKTNAYDNFLFSVSTVISNNTFKVAKTDGSGCAAGTYADGINSDLSINCVPSKFNTAMTPVYYKGDKGPRGAPSPKVGPPGRDGSNAYCHVKGGGVALTSSQKAALNRLQGPARIISGNSSTVHVVNKHGSTYSMSNSSITSWASRGGGCFEEGTTITMADGSKRAIENIKKGDLVWNPLTKMPALVKKGVKGPEDFIMYSFKVNGEEVKVTKTHPMLTDRGILKAEDVKADDRMLWKSGELLEIETITTYKTENDVYNLFLVSEDGKDIEGAVIANGVITGDLDMQQQLQNKGSNSAKLSH